jgi:homoserine/homoserine lactone efflux protein
VPVDGSTLAAFAVAAIAIVLSPGPDTIVILRHALVSGRGAGFAAVAGVQIGMAVHTGLAVAGISVIVAASPFLFKTVALIGAAYLAWLGVQGFRDGGVIGISDGPVAGPWRAGRQALLSNVLNPKVILLFLALLPNFVDPASGPVAVQMIVLGALLIAINVVWQLPLAWAADRVSAWLGSATVQRWIGRASGAVLLAFAALMLYDHLA